jgi:porin
MCQDDTLSSVGVGGHASISARHDSPGSSARLLVVAGCCLAVSLLATAVSAAEGPLDDNDPSESEIGGIEYEPSLVMGYGASWEGENPTSIDTDLDSSFPQHGALFETNVPKRWFTWKEDLYKTHGLKLGFSYQSLYQKTTDSLTAEDTAWGGWLLIEASWDAVDRGGDFQGGIVAALDWRQTIGGNAEPGFFQFQTGSQWPTDFAYPEWDPWFASLYWEQQIGKDKFVLRVGNQAAAQFVDFFRYKDGRTSFTGSSFTAATASVPAPAPGFGASFRLTPIDDSEFYVAGTLNDMNADVDELDWGNVFDYGQFFYGLEFGMNWRRGKGDFDHLHLLLFYADKVDTSPPIFENKAGGGFKLAGEKQWNRLVGFGSYTYNTVEGGNFGIAVTRQMANVGFAVNRPLNIGGEVGVGFSWAEPQDGLTLVGLPQRDPLKDQYGMEIYWKILVTGDLWVTPNLQVIVNPTYNSSTKTVIVPGLKFRFFL